MSSPPQPQVSLKLLIDKKILYGEADKNFIDFLFTILALPVGTFVRLLSAEGMVGSLGNLYRSVESLNINYFQTNHSKDSLLKPKVSVPNSECRQLLQIGYRSASKIYYRCHRTTKPTCRNNFTTIYLTTCPSCCEPMYESATYIESAIEKKEASSDEAEGYVKGMIKYMVMDDLTVKPMSSMSNVSILRELKVKDVEHIEEKVINFDMADGLKLFRASLDSTTVLNDVFLHKIDFSKSNGQ